MSTKDNYSKTLRFSTETDEKLSKLSQKFSLSKFQFFNKMVEYFHRTKKDPSDINDEVLKNTLVKNHDTYIRFIRAQEEKILIPVKTEVDRMVQSQIKILDCFNGQVLKANRDLLNNQQAQVEKSEEMQQLMKTIAEKLETKESLKLKFQYILNQYAKARENFGFTTSVKEKEELVQEARQMVAKL
ncbi:BfmA/BtgA family mobilization protein [Mucilaginibacter sp.]|uniref:BfmA/BtgA family mobilization protein n=1 Tax=Mucilaginibacter sp. TaxID=1882438 RepID=UPI0025DA3F19|nr:BfmA/BtgA family mobilization protein [Mucilaginibacter sp.]